MRKKNQARVFFPWERTGGLVRRLALHRARPFVWAALAIGLIVLLGLRERRLAGERRTRATMSDVSRALDRYLAEHEGQCPRRFAELAPYAAALACLNLLVAIGVKRENIWVTDIDGVVYEGRQVAMDRWKAAYAQKTQARKLAEVIGVLPPDLRFLRADPAIVLPMQLDRTDLAALDFNAIARLRPGITVEQANADVERMIRIAPERYPRGISANMLVEARFAPNVRPLHVDAGHRRMVSVGRRLRFALGDVDLFDPDRLGRGRAEFFADDARSRHGPGQAPPLVVHGRADRDAGFQQAANHRPSGHFAFQIGDDEVLFGHDAGL